MTMADNFKVSQLVMILENYRVPWKAKMVGLQGVLLLLCNMEE